MESGIGFKINFDVLQNSTAYGFRTQSNRKNEGKKKHSETQEEDVLKLNEHKHINGIQN